MTPPAAVQFTDPEASRRATQNVAKAAKRATAAAVTDAEHEDEIASFKSESSTHKRSFGWLNIDELVVDPSYQRPKNPTEVNKIGKNFSEGALGTVTVSARVDAAGETTYILVDGQQRKEGAALAGFHGRIRADVHHGLTLADEARLFRLLNFRSAVQPVYLFKAALIEGDKDALAVQKILDDLGIPFGTARGYSGAASSRRLVGRKNGETSLRWALAQVQKIYDSTGNGGCYDASVVEAFYWLFDKFGTPRIDEKNLYEKLARVGGGTADLVGHAKTIKSVRGGRISVNIIRAIIARYNHHKAVNSRAALPDWTLTDEAAEAEVGASE
jgi:hypothetical protein